MSRLVGPLLIGVLLAIILVYGARQYLAGRNPWETKISSAKSILHYEIDAKRPVSFAVYPTDRELQIVSHVIVPSDAPYEPETRMRYGLRVSVIEGDAQTWSHDYWLESRQSKADLLNGVWMQEGAFMTDGRQVSDPRLIGVALPAEIPRDEAVLRVELLDYPDHPALLRVYRTTVRPAFEMTRTEFAMTAEDRQRLTERLFMENWRDMTPFERERLLQTQWERLTPTGSSGVDYLGVSVYTTNFQSPTQQTEPDPAIMLAPYQGIALNVNGPARLDLHARLEAKPLSFADQRAGKPAPMPPLGPNPVTLSVRRIDGPEDVKQQTLSAHCSGNAFTKLGGISVPRGKRSSVWIVNESADTLRLAAILSEGENAQVLGDVSFLLAPVEPTTRPMVIPEWRYFKAVRLLPGRTPVRFSLYSPNAGQTGRIVAYRVFGAPTSQPAPFKLQATLTDDSGKTLLNREIQAEAAMSPFESFPLQDPAQDERIGEAQTVFFRFPKGQNTLELSADAPVDVLVQTAWCIHCEPELEAGYTDEVGELIWRNEPTRWQRWFAVNPVDEADLLAAGRLDTIRAQPRLDLPPESRSGWTTDFTPIEPQGTPECAKLLEQARNPLESREDWTYTTYSELFADRDETVDVPALFFGRPVVLRYDLQDGSQLGQTLRIVEGDTALAEELIRTQSGEIGLRLSVGAHRLRIAGPAAGIRYWINIPVVDMPIERRYTQRTICRLGSAGLSLPVAANGSNPISINVLVYRLGDKGSSATVGARFDGGNPRMRAPALATGVTPAQHSETLPFFELSRSVLGSMRDQRVSAPQVFFMTLFEDASRGGHSLHVYRQSDDELWIRAFISGDRSKPGDGYMTWTTTRR